MRINTIKELLTLIAEWNINPNCFTVKGRNSTLLLVPTVASIPSSFTIFLNKSINLDLLKNSLQNWEGEYINTLPNEDNSSYELDF